MRFELDENLPHRAADTSGEAGADADADADTVYDETSLASPTRSCWRPPTPRTECWCGMAFRLRNLVGLQPRLAPELGYGKAVHHGMRAVAEATRDSGQMPGPSEIDAILDASFFLPTANRLLHRQLKDAARRLVTTYAAEHPDDLRRVWEVERPFELHLDGVTLAGRADVILDHEDGVPTALAIVDYKTSTANEPAHYDLQLQVYADAGRREGLDVRGAYVHDLDTTSREPVPTTPADLASAEQIVTTAAARIRARDYTPDPGRRCRTCEVRAVCSSAQRWTTTGGGPSRQTRRQPPERRNEPLTMAVGPTELPMARSPDVTSYAGRPARRSSG
ncbi:MAG: PD-(D/E)XK nuclease family protein [Actinomycetota bacterium]|nr:PD-(D/E)XK nuclease family protein [Actinomycetota bacterium]